LQTLAGASWRWRRASILVPFRLSAQPPRRLRLLLPPVPAAEARLALCRQKDSKDGRFTQVVSNVLDTKMREDLERLKKIRNHRGLRHYWGLRVRGQHTKTTGRRGACSFPALPGFARLRLLAAPRLLLNTVNLTRTSPRTDGWRQQEALSSAFRGVAGIDLALCAFPCLKHIRFQGHFGQDVLSHETATHS